MSYSPPYSRSKNKLEVKLDLSNYATKSDLKTQLVLIHHNLLKNIIYLDEIDIDKLETDVDELKRVPTDLSKLSYLVKNDVVKKTEYDAKIKVIKDKIPNITNLATNASLNAKINEVKNEIPSITNLATTDPPTAVENKIPNISDIVKKAGYDAEIKNIKDKYFTTFDYNKFTYNILEKKITLKKLVNESGFSEKVKTLATKEEIKKLATKAK